MTLAFIIQPFIQLGLSYWLSGAAMMFLLVFFSIHPMRAIRFGFRGDTAIIFLLCALSMLASFADVTSNSFEEDILFYGRSLLFWLLMTICLKYLASTSSDIEPLATWTRRAMLIMSLATAVLVVTQDYYLSRGQFVGIDPSYFVSNTLTLIDSMDLLYSRLRPPGTFGEPSYLAFICVSTMVAALPMLTEKATRAGGLLIIGCMVLAGLISRSLSFVIAGSLIGYVAALNHERSRRVVLLCTVLVVPLLAVIILAGGFDRLSAVFLGQDPSTNARILAPISSLAEFLIAHPFGMTRGQLMANLSSITARDFPGVPLSLDNGILSSAYYFGVAGLLMVWHLVTRVKEPILVTYLLLSMNFNGAIFSVDKAAVIILTVAVYHAASRRVTPSEVPAVPRKGTYARA